MATRFYLNSEDVILPGGYVTGGGWEQTGEGVNRRLETLSTIRRMPGEVQTDVTVPITTTQEVLIGKCLSAPLEAQTISGTFSMVLKCWEDVAGANAKLAWNIRILTPEGRVRATLDASLNPAASVEFPVTASKATRIASAIALTSSDAAYGDFVALEFGVHLTAPSAAGVASVLMGYSYGVADYALTSGLTTSLNPWCEFSQDLQFLKQPQGVIRSGAFHR